MIFDIAIKDLKVVYRDKLALAVLLLMPAAIIIILGLALSSMFSNEPAVEKFSIAVVDNDGANMSRVLVDGILKENLHELLDVKEVDDNEADILVANGDAAAVITLPEGFTKDFENGNPVKIKIKSSVDNEFHSGIVESIIESFAESVSLNRIGTESIIKVLIKSGTVDMQNMDIKIGQIVSSIQGSLNRKLVEFNEDKQERSENLSAIQYYSATMLVMFMLFGAIQGSKAFVEEREMKTLERIIAARANKAQIIAGKFLGLYIVCILQSAILIVFTSLVYNVDWGNSLPGIFLITVCAVFTGAAFGMFIAAVSRTSNAADGLGMILVQIFTLIGGGMVPYYILPESIKKLAMVTLNWWAVKGYHDIMLGSGLQNVIPYCAILLLMGIAYLSFGTARLKIR